MQHWNTLQERASLRKEHLLASYALQKFIAAVRDLERWADTLGTEIGTQERVRDAVSAQALKTEHDRIKAEIETREPDFNGKAASRFLRTPLRCNERRFFSRCQDRRIDD